MNGHDCHCPAPCGVHPAKRKNGSGRVETEDVNAVLTAIDQCMDDYARARAVIAFACIRRAIEAP